MGDRYRGDRSRSPGRRDGGRSRGGERISILCRNLPLDTRAGELRRMFERYGSIRDVYIPRDYYTRRPKGFGFIEFEDSKDADEAVYRMDGKEFAGRRLEVCRAKEGRKRPEDMKMRSRDSGRRRDRYRDRSRSRDRSRDRARHRSRSRSISRGRSRSRSRSISRGRSRSRSRSMSRDRSESANSERSNRSKSPAREDKSDADIDKNDIQEVNNP